MTIEMVFPQTAPGHDFCAAVFDLARHDALFPHRGDPAHIAPSFGLLPPWTRDLALMVAAYVAAHRRDLNAVVDRFVAKPPLRPTDSVRLILVCALAEWEARKVSSPRAPGFVFGGWVAFAESQVPAMTGLINAVLRAATVKEAA